MQEQLKDYHVYLSADVFELSLLLGDTDRIGQTWMRSPLTWIISAPWFTPAITGRVISGWRFRMPIRHNSEKCPGGFHQTQRFPENPAIIRPWLQNFTASWIKGNILTAPGKIREQIEAARLGDDVSSLERQ